jgi:Na+-translocating ferredoxin:NAD+ oxidoreductase RnfG subunit
MEAIKFVAMYSLEIIVIALVGAVLLAGLYQLVRDKVRARRVATPAAVQEPAKRS